MEFGVYDFFSFCGRISKLYLRQEEGKDTSSAVIQFETESAAKTALLLTNALIVDRPITVTAYLPSVSQSNTSYTTTSTTAEPYTTSTEVKAVDGSQLSQKDFGGVSDENRSKTSVVASLLAAGYVLAENALDKAKELDEKNNFSTRAKEAVDQLKVRAHELDVQYGITEKANAMKITVTETAKKIDTEFGISEKAVAAANVLKTGAVVGLQKAQENPTFKKGMDSVVTTAQKVSSSVTQTFNDVKTQTNKEIEDKESKQKAEAETKLSTSPPSTMTMDSPQSTETTNTQQ